MSAPHPAGGFAGDAREALAAAGSGGCCGNPARSTLALPDPATAAPCCGSVAEAAAEGSCCGSAAKSEAVAAAQGCCG